MTHEIAKQGGYYAIHQWLRYHYGRADRCENLECPKTSARFEWALKRGEEHAHDRTRYIQMCKTCHLKYDKVNVGSKSALWKGGRPKCGVCEKPLSTYKNKTGLCGLHNRQSNPPWIGKSRKQHNQLHAVV